MCLVIIALKHMCSVIRSVQGIVCKLMQVEHPHLLFAWLAATWGFQDFVNLK